MLQPVTYQRPAFNPFKLRPFDLRVALVALALGVLIALTALRGDNVGVQLVRFTPVERAGPSAVIAIQFSETMNRESVAERLSTDPPTLGEIAWAGSRLIFRPSPGLQPGTKYTVVLQPGAESEQGRKIL